MADLSDVQDALASMIGAAIYPNGPAQPSAVGVPAKIYPGWPTPADLNPDLAAGICHVSIFPTQAEQRKPVTSSEWQQQAAPTQTLAIGQLGQVLTITGTVSTPQNVMLRVSGVDYAYAVQAGDTLASIASALAARVPGATASGAQVTIPTSGRIQAARVGASGVLVREIGRQERVFRISVWSDTPANRNALAGLIDASLRAVSSLLMPDQFRARLAYVRTAVIDAAQNEGVYRRDLDYAVEYSTTQTTTATQITQEQLNTATPEGVAIFTTTI